MKGLLSAALALAALPAATAGAAQPSPPVSAAVPADEAINLLAPADLERFRFWDSVTGGAPAASFRKTGGVAGRPVFTASTPTGSTNQYGIGASWAISRPIRAGDVLLASFAVRALAARQETGEGEGLFYFEEKSSGTREFTYSFSAGPEWTIVNVPFVARTDHAGVASNLSLTFANLPQTLEIADLKLLNFGKRVALSDLPVTRQTYAGRDADAAWRKRALQRIEEIRTAPLVVKVVDADGRPVPGARIEAAMTASDFLWGTEVDVDQLLEPGPDGDRYRDVVRTMFDSTVIGNGLKWPRWRDPAARAKTLQAIDWLTANGKRIKGHSLVWPAWKFSPEAVAKDPQRGETLGPLILAHISDITAATRGKLIGWDVVNEAIHEQDYWQHLPRTAAAEWFRMVRAQEPRLQLTFNEYGMLNRSSSPLMIEKVLGFVNELERHGAKVDVLGVQAHYGQMVRAPEAILSDLDLLSAQGHEVQITEFDFNTVDERLQADFTRDLLIALYSHPAVTGYFQWGFWQRKHWKPDAAMFRADWSEKPSVQVFRDLMSGWKSRLTAATDGTGTAAAKGHLGRYRITVTAGGRSRVIEDWRLTKDGDPLVVRLP